jgi:AhpD family alkylhydroperoxidase
MKPGSLAVREKELIDMAVGLAQGCTECIYLHTEGALKAGATREQVVEAAGVAVLMANAVPVEKPAAFIRDDYRVMLDDMRSGRVKELRKLMHFFPMPNGKFELNNAHPGGATGVPSESFDLAEENWGWPEAGAAERERIFQRYWAHAEGYLWLLQNDPEVPPAIREAARQYGFPKDEFTDNRHRPHHIYVRQGHAPERPYNIAYHPHDWRGWSEFGAGALGDMGCHTMDAAFYALNLGDPISIQAESPQAVVESFPAWSAITYEFPARGKMPPVKVTWSDGGKQPPRPKDLDAGRALTKSGQYYVGEKGTIFDGQDYCNSPRIIPEARMRELQPSLPPKTLRRPDPLGNPYLAWTQAIRKGDPEWAGSHFAYSTRLTEFVVLGNFALRAPGKKILWDGAQMAVTNLPELNQFLKPTFRSGWTHLELEKVQRNGTEDLSVPAQLRDGSPGYMKKNQKK